MNSHSKPDRHNQLIHSGFDNCKNHRGVVYSTYQKVVRLFFLSLIMAGSVSSVGLLYRSMFINGGDKPVISHTSEHEPTQANKVSDTGPESTDTIQSHKVKSIRIPTR